MENLLEKIPEPVRKYGLYAAGAGVVILLISRSRAAAAPAPAAGVNTGAVARPVNPWANSSLGGSASSPNTQTVGNPAAQVDPMNSAAAALTAQTAAWDMIYKPLADLGGKSRFQLQSEQQLLLQQQQQSSSLDLSIRAQNAQVEANNAAMRNQADIAQRAKDRDENLFRNPSNFLKGIGGVASSLGKVFRF